MNVFSKKLKRNSSYNVISVTGAGFGDEGKGKITDIYASEWADVVVRANGGCNAGHTVTFDGNKVALRALPSGILTNGVENFICHGCVINPSELVEEINKVKNIVDFELKLHISDRAHVITEYDIFFDKYYGDSIKTTGNGIGPCYADKAYRQGIRICDLYKSEKDIAELLDNTMSKEFLDNKKIDMPNSIDVAKKLKENFESIKQYVCDTMLLLNYFVMMDKKILFEGAQAAMLDNSYGFYPFVTSSTPTTAGLSAGSGVAPRHFNTNIGVVKSYCTRVGNGPFVTEFKDKLSDTIREKAHEYGTVTGRPRRIGWFDCVTTRYSALLNGYDTLALMLLDVLSGVDELKICTEYIDKNERIQNNIPADVEKLSEFKPVYVTVPGWKEDISNCKTYNELPDEAKNFIQTIEEYVGIPISIISVGPDRKQTIFRE